MIRGDYLFTKLFVTTSLSVITCSKYFQRYHVYVSKKRLRSAPVAEQGVFLEDGLHRMFVDATVAAHVAAVRIEVEVPRIARIARVERPQPVVATTESVWNSTATSVAAGRKEERLSILLQGEESPLHTVPRRPLVGGVRQQLVSLTLGGSVPAGTFKFQVSGFKFQVSSFRFQVSSFKFQVSGFKSYCCALEEGVAGDQHKKALVGHVAIEVAEFDFGGATAH